MQHRGQDGPNKVKSLIQSRKHTSPQRKANMVDLAPKAYCPHYFSISRIESQWACLSMWNSSSMTCRSTRTNSSRIQFIKCGPDGVHTRYLLISPPPLPQQKKKKKILQNLVFVKVYVNHIRLNCRRLETIFDYLDAGTLSFCFGHEFRLSYFES